MSSGATESFLGRVALPLSKLYYFVMSKTKPKFYTVTQAAESSGVTVSYVRQLLRAGKLRGEKIGERAWILPSNQVEVLCAKAKSNLGRPRKLEK